MAVSGDPTLGKFIFEVQERGSGCSYRCEELVGSAVHNPFCNFAVAQVSSAVPP